MARDGEMVMRFTLEVSAIGQRRGFTSATALREALRAELTKDQATQTQMDQTTPFVIPRLVSSPA
jgi:hypothetical protein